MSFPKMQIVLPEAKKHICPAAPASPELPAAPGAFVAAPGAAAATRRRARTSRWPPSPSTLTARAIPSDAFRASTNNQIAIEV